MRMRAVNIDRIYSMFWHDAVWAVEHRSRDLVYPSFGAIVKVVINLNVFGKMERNWLKCEVRSTKTNNLHRYTSPGYDHKGSVVSLLRHGADNPTTPPPPRTK